MTQTLDLITLGRASVDLYGEQVGGRLEDMASFAKYVGGSPTNTAIGAARLGLKVGLITREELPYFAGVWAIFGHGNVAGMGEALAGVRKTLPTFRAHNEQGMAHAAIAFAKGSRRCRAMACTTSIVPGATNMVTAAALAHVNRLPVLLLPGDEFATRRPDPVLQQIEDFADGTITANEASAHGYDLYYLNVMAAPKRTWLIQNDPNHAWLLES